MNCNGEGDCDWAPCPHETPAVSSQDLQCYGCLKVGDYSTFGIPVKCPDCGSMEIWTARVLNRGEQK